MRRATQFIAPALILVASTVGIGNTASGGSDLPGPEEHCGTGDVTAMTNAFYPLFWNSAEPAFDDVERCQFRLFFEPAEGICFDELDHFVGGIVLFDERAYRDLVAQVEIEISVPGLGSLEPEQVETPIKGLAFPDLGSAVWKQWSMAFNGLEPGSYTVVTTVSFAGSVVDVLEVEFHVLPHEDAHVLGQPASGLAGSVACPPEVLS